MNNNFKIKARNYIEGDEYSISKLMYRNFPNPLAPEIICDTWKWQFKNKFSVFPSVVVAETNSKIVAQYAVMRLPMNYKSTRVEGAISTATITDSRYRGKGLFTRLARGLYKDIKNNGCQIVFGFPNIQSIHGFTSRLGWFEIDAFPLHLRIIDPFPFVKKYMGDNILSKFVSGFCNLVGKAVFTKKENECDEYKIEILPRGVLPEDVSILSKESFSSEKISVVRDSKYLKWRYIEKPFFKYEIYLVTKDADLYGYFVISVNEKFDLKTIYVMECTAKGDNSDVYFAILKKLCSIGRERNASSVSMLLLRNHPQYKVFRKCGFISVAKNLLPQKIYFAAKVLKDNIDPEYVKNPNNWYITWGDLDVI